MKATHVIQTASRRWYVVRLTGGGRGYTSDGARCYLEPGGRATVTSLVSRPAPGDWTTFDDCPHTRTDGWLDDGTPGPDARWYDPALERRSKGRPPLSADEPTHVAKIRMPVSVWAAVVEAASLDGASSAAEWARDVLERAARRRIRRAE